MSNANFSIAIQHTPHDGNRRSWVKSMLEKFRAERPDLCVAIVADSERQGSWPTYLRTLRATAGAKHHLVLNDDITVCQDFLASVDKVIQARPGQIISLYTNSPWVPTARARGQAWIEKSLVASPALIWPTALIHEFIDWERFHIRNDFHWEDARISMWLHKTRRPAFATVPSLAQHLGCQASLVGLNGRSKVATWYVGDHRSALGIDWSRGLKSTTRDPAPIKREWWRYYEVPSLTTQPS